LISRSDRIAESPGHNTNTNTNTPPQARAGFLVRRLPSKIFGCGSAALMGINIRAPASTLRCRKILIAVNVLSLIVLY
jgi:hypothetical protein